jgi:hypothetical protein
LAGVVITLCNSEKKILAAIVTDCRGSYVFYNLPAVQYIVKEANLGDVPFDVLIKTEAMISTVLLSS